MKNGTVTSNTVSNHGKSSWLIASLVVVALGLLIIFGADSRGLLRGFWKVYPSEGSEFVGKWQSKHPDASGRFSGFAIARNGYSFLFFDGGGSTTYPAILKDDVLQVMSVPLAGTIVLAHSKGSDTIIGLGNEFKRVK